MAFRSEFYALRRCGMRMASGLGLGSEVRVEVRVLVKFRV